MEVINTVLNSGCATSLNLNSTLYSNKVNYWVCFSYFPQKAYKAFLIIDQFNY